MFVWTFQIRRYCPAEGYRPFCNVVTGMTELSQLKGRLLNEKKKIKIISVSDEMDGISKKLILA